MNYKQLLEEDLVIASGALKVQHVMWLEKEWIVLGCAGFLNVVKLCFVFAVLS